MRRSITKFVPTISVLLLILTSAQNVYAEIIIYKVPNAIATSDFTKIVANFLKWMLSVAGAMALILLIFAGMMYMTSAGDPQKASSAKKMIFITVGGLLLALLSYSILVILDNILTK